MNDEQPIIMSGLVRDLDSGPVTPDARIVITVLRLMRSGLTPTLVDSPMFIPRIHEGSLLDHGLLDLFVSLAFACFRTYMIVIL